MILMFPKAHKKMEALVTGDDSESAHAEADSILCEVLKALGQKKLVRTYHAIQPKWYA